MKYHSMTSYMFIGVEAMSCHRKLYNEKLSLLGIRVNFYNIGLSGHFPGLRFCVTFFYVFYRNYRFYITCLTYYWLSSITYLGSYWRNTIVGYLRWVTPDGRYPGERVKQLKVRSVDSSEVVVRALRFQLMYVSQVGSGLGLRLGFGLG